MGVTITDVDVLEYRMPLKRGFGTARGTVRSARNLIIRLEATGADGGRVTGLGEAAPRGPRITGDTVEGSWELLVAAAQQLLGRTLRVSDRTASLDAVRTCMASVGGLASDRAGRRHGARPFRGTLAGVDMALLDLVARSNGRTVSDLLGRRRDHAPITAATISSLRDAETVRRKTHAYRDRFPMSRLKATGDPGADLAMAVAVAEVNRRADAPKPVWLDVNGGYEHDTAERFVIELTDLVRRGLLPDRVIVEQPVQAKDRTRLAELQQLADRRLRGRPWRRSPGRVTIMADESIWDAPDLEELLGAGGCGAINIKTQKVGGVLAAYDLACTAARHEPGLEIYLGGMIGTSDITCWAMQNLGMAVPRLDYFTSTPPGNVEDRIASPRIDYLSRAGNRLSAQTLPGIGTDLSEEVVAPYVTRTLRLAEGV
jgi:L-alanine-DL-glutamate epimerase-like enolase superfamily enzyme